MDSVIWSCSSKGTLLVLTLSQLPVSLSSFDFVGTTDLFDGSGVAVVLGNIGVGSDFGVGVVVGTIDFVGDCLIAFSSVGSS